MHPGYFISPVDNYFSVGIDTILSANEEPSSNDTGLPEGYSKSSRQKEKASPQGFCGSPWRSLAQGLGFGREQEEGRRTNSFPPWSLSPPLPQLSETGHYSLVLALLSITGPTIPSELPPKSRHFYLDKGFLTPAWKIGLGVPSTLLLARAGITTGPSCQVENKLVFPPVSSVSCHKRQPCLRMPRIDILHAWHIRGVWQMLVWPNEVMSWKEGPDAVELTVEFKKLLSPAWCGPEQTKLWIHGSWTFRMQDIHRSDCLLPFYPVFLFYLFKIVNLSSCSLKIIMFSRDPVTFFQLTPNSCFRTEKPVLGASDLKTKLFSVSEIPYSNDLLILKNRP